MWDLIVSVPDHCLSFYFEGRMWDLIVSVPYHCLSFYFEGRMWDLIVSVPYHCLSFYFEGRMWDLIVSVPYHCLSFYFEGRMWDLIVSVPDHYLSFYFPLVTDNCPSWISGRERMAVEIISWLISTNECCQTWGSNPRPSAYQANKMSVRPAKIQISLGIRPVGSESSLSAWRNLGSWATHWAHSEDSDQTGRMPRLIWDFAGTHSFCWCRGSYFLHFSLSLERKHDTCTVWLHGQSNQNSVNLSVNMLKVQST